jgi:hypothetical protein
MWGRQEDAEYISQDAHDCLDHLGTSFCSHMPGAPKRVHVCRVLTATKLRRNRRLDA